MTCGCTCRSFCLGADPLTGPVRVDKSQAPLAVSDILKGAGVDVVWAMIPAACPRPARTPPKSRRRDRRICATRQRWSSSCAGLTRLRPRAGLTEISVVQALEGFRRATKCAA